MKRPVILILAVALVLNLAAALEAAPPGKWKLLGKRSVTDRVDHDVIQVSAAKGKFSAIRIKVEKRAVQFHSVKLHFVNGKVQDVKLKDVIRAGGSSRVIDIDGGRRTIKKVVFYYDAQSLGGKARVKLYGRR